jgi:hypothetical protein
MEVFKNGGEMTPQKRFSKENGKFTFGSRLRVLRRAISEYET